MKDIDAINVLKEVVDSEFQTAEQEEAYDKAIKSIELVSKIKEITDSFMPDDMFDDDIAELFYKIKGLVDSHFSTPIKLDIFENINSPLSFIGKNSKEGKSFSPVGLSGNNGTYPTKEELFSFLEEEKIFPSRYKDSEKTKVCILLDLQGQKFACIHNIPIPSIQIINFNLSHNVNGHIAYSIRIDKEIEDLFLINIPNVKVYFALIPGLSYVCVNPEKYGFKKG